MTKERPDRRWVEVVREDLWSISFEKEDVMMRRAGVLGHPRIPKSGNPRVVQVSIVIILIGRFFCLNLFCIDSDVFRSSQLHFSFQSAT